MTEGIGKEFMRRTYYGEMGPSLQEQGEPQPPLELPYDPDLPQIVLTREFQLSQLDFVELLRKRRTLRAYAQTPLTLEELSFLLWASQGVKTVRDTRATFRTVPSAGARHAFETLVLANRVEGIQPGLYRYLALEHSLIPYNLDSEITGQVQAACLEQNQVGNSAATFLWVAVVERMYWRYHERGYRYLHLDAGHVCQNLTLAAEAVGCGVCAIAAFDDASLNEALGLDGDGQFAIYLATVGKR